jgi:class I fructose-bisphosphate aldolase
MQNRAMSDRSSTDPETRHQPSVPSVERILPSDRRVLIVPIDHGIVNGNIAGLEDPREMIERLGQAGVDGTLMSAGWARRIGHLAKGHGMSLSLAADFQVWGNRPGKLESVRGHVQILSVERARSLGADAVKVLFPWGLPDQVIQENVALVAQLAEEAQDVGLPLMVEPLWFGEKVSDEEHDQLIVNGSRIAVELGADILKIPAVSVAALEKILAWDVPTVFLGGAKQDDPKALFDAIANGVRAGARGIVMGRNVWQSDRMMDVIADLRSLLQES